MPSGLVNIPVIGGTGTGVTKAYVDTHIEGYQWGNGPTINYVPMFNGTEVVWAPYNANFSFSIASFSDGQAGQVDMGVGTWKSTMSFSATYNNGTPDSAYVSFPGWTDVTMTNNGLGPTSSGQSVSYPSSSGTTLTWTLHASKNSTNYTSTQSTTFLTRIYYGLTTVASGWVQSDITSLTNYLANSRGANFTLAPGANQYILFVSPVRLGTPQFAIGGFNGGFNPLTTIFMTINGFSEPLGYYIARTANANLGAGTNVVVS